MDEIRFLRNQLSNLADDDQKRQYRRSLVVMLYAHYEGFCKFALLRYVKAINQAGIKCEEATSGVAAGAWGEVFTAVETGDKKHKIFKNELPLDEGLHRFARRREFLERLGEFEQMPVQVSEGAVSTESNLWPITLKKNLYRVGLEHDSFASHDGDIRMLLNRRNNIAHGAERRGLEQPDYQKLEGAVFQIMEDLMELVMDSIRNERYRRPGAPEGG